ncbi:phosphotransferase family protein [Deinococcus frigens]|uniref:phosphotransferase family protein n=1 Tax=Deinococcus frigens TaxID=249403 RepID=UPI000A57BC29
MLVQKVQPGARLLHSWPLTGGVSARVTALEFRRANGQIGRLVVRQYGQHDLRANPDIARQEDALLRALHAAGLPVPLPHYFEAGLLVTDFMPGATEFQPADGPDCVRQMAAFLARLHALARTDLPFLRFLAPPAPRPAIADESLSESRIRNALERLGSPALKTPAVLHGDFWPGNLLWSGGQLSAVIDWEDAVHGDPLADLGNARLELLFFLGAGAMQAFTREYAALSGAHLAWLPYWDLRAALRPCGRLGNWGLEAGVERRMRQRHRAFVNAALEHL